MARSSEEDKLVSEGFHGHDDIFIRSSIETKVDGRPTDDFFFDTWTVDAFVYDLDGGHPSTRADGSIKVGEATVLLHRYGFDGENIATNMEEHSDWYMKLGATFDNPDQPPLDGLFDQWMEYGDSGRIEMLLIANLAIKPRWRGHKLSLQFIEAIVNTLGRHSWMTAIHPVAYSKRGRDDLATHKLADLATEGGFVRYYDSDVFVRPSDPDSPLPAFPEIDPLAAAEKAAATSLRHESSYGPFLAWAQLPFDTGSAPWVSLPLPDKSRVAPLHLPDGYSSPSGIKLPSVEDPEMVISYGSGVELTVTADADGPVATQSGAPESELPDTGAALEWAKAFYIDLMEYLPGVHATANSVVEAWLADGDPQVVDGQPKFRVPWLPTGIVEPAWSRPGRWVATPTNESETPGLSITAVGPAGEQIRVGSVRVEPGATVVVEIDPELPWDDTDVKMSVDLLEHVGRAIAGEVSIKQALFSQAVNYLGFGNTNSF